MGGRGFATRDDFAIYLENISGDEYLRDMGELFEGGDGAPSARLDEFRKSVNSAYAHLYDEGKFHSGKKTRPLLQQCFAAILLASYDPDSYILYRYTEYKKTAEWIGLTVPSTPPSSVIRSIWTWPCTSWTVQERAISLFGTWWTCTT